MANKQIPALPPLDESPADDDRLAIRDTSSGSDKSLRVDRLDDRVNERGFAQSVDSVSTLRTSTFPASLERLWLSGYYGVGTAGGGPLYRVGGGFSSTDDNGDSDFVDADGVKWSRSRIAENSLDIVSATPLKPLNRIHEPDHFYTGWPFGKLMYDPEEDSLNIAYTAGSGHSANDSHVFFRKIENVSQGGKTWSDRILVAAPVGDNGVNGHTLTKMPNGDYIILARYAPGGSITVDEYFIFRSTDSGLTWSGEQWVDDSNNNILPRESAELFVVPGTETLLTFARFPDDTVEILRSTDAAGANGTWERIGLSYETTAPPFEGSFVKHPDTGDIVMVARGGGGNPPPVYTVSNDDGQTWSVLSATDMAVSNQPVALMLREDNQTVEVLTGVRDNPGWLIQSVVRVNDLFDGKLGEPQFIFQTSEKGDGDSSYPAIVNGPGSSVFAAYYNAYGLFGVDITVLHGSTGQGRTAQQYGNGDIILEVRHKDEGCWVRRDGWAFVWKRVTVATTDLPGRAFFDIPFSLSFPSVQGYGPAKTGIVFDSEDSTAILSARATVTTSLRDSTRWSIQGPDAMEQDELCTLFVEGFVDNYPEII